MSSQYDDPPYTLQPNLQPGAPSGEPEPEPSEIGGLPDGPAPPDPAPRTKVQPAPGTARQTPLRQARAHPKPGQPRARWPGALSARSTSSQSVAASAQPVDASSATTWLR